MANDLRKWGYHSLWLNVQRWCAHPPPKKKPNPHGKEGLDISDTVWNVDNNESSRDSTKATSAKKQKWIQQMKRNGSTRSCLWGTEQNNRGKALPHVFYPEWTRKTIKCVLISDIIPGRSNASTSLVVLQKPPEHPSKIMLSQKKRGEHKRMQLLWDSIPPIPACRPPNAMTTFPIAQKHTFFLSVKLSCGT